MSIRSQCWWVRCLVMTMAICLGPKMGLGSESATGATAKEEAKVSDDELQIRGVFDSVLPGTEKKHRLRFLFRPHLGDLHRRDILRVPVGLRYGLSSRWELAGEFDGYFSHGFGSSRWFDDAGFSSMRFSSKYQFRKGLPGWDTGAGIDYLSPIGNPPKGLSDGLEHFNYFVTFSRDLVSLPGWRVFWSVGADEVTATDYPVTLGMNELGDDSLSVSGGFVWPRGPRNYTLEISYATTRLTGTADREVLTVRPGVVWKVPKKYTFNSKGDWLIGVAARWADGTDGTDYGLSGKLRVSFDFKKWWRSHFPKEKREWHGS